MTHNGPRKRRTAGSAARHCRGKAPAGCSIRCVDGCVCERGGVGIRLFVGWRHEPSGLVDRSGIEEACCLHANASPVLGLPYPPCCVLRQMRRFPPLSNHSLNRTDGWPGADCQTTSIISDKADAWHEITTNAPNIPSQCSAGRAVSISLGDAGGRRKRRKTLCVTFNTLARGDEGNSSVFLFALTATSQRTNA